MFIETTFMRYGRGTGGILSITLKPETTKTWVFSLQTCRIVESDLAAMADNEKITDQTTHNYERKSRLNVDAHDRESIGHRLAKCTDPPDPVNHTDDIVNSVNGRVGQSSVHVPWN